MTSPTPSDDAAFASVAARYAALTERVAGVDRRWRHPVRAVAVTKGFDERAVTAAAAAGCAAIGENYAQEVRAKRAAIEGSRIPLHFIGHLQTNKVRRLAGLVAVWSSVDRPSVVDELAKRAPRAVVRLQVNTTGEEQKGGCAPDQVAQLLERARAAGLQVDGLMTVGPTAGPAEAARPAFALLRSLVDELGLAECSMGMSGDLDVAVEEGSTEIRVGTMLFGPRPQSP